MYKLIKNMPKVSVIIPVYNSEKFIVQTLESVFAQTLQDFELLIIDDESKDTSISLCEKYHDPRMKIIHQKNRGLAGARNTGIRHAQGDYLAFLDSDDLWLSEKLEKHVQHLDLSPKVGVSFSRSSFIDEQGNSLGIYQIPKLTNIDPGHLFCRNPISNGSAAVFRKEVFDDIKFQANLYGEVEDFYFDDEFRQAEDVECWLRIALQTSWLIEGIPESLTQYRVNAGGLSANVYRQYEYWEKIITKTQTYNPAFMAQWANKARAYKLRYLARRAVRERSRAMATEFIHSALKTDPTILLEEPLRTVLTLGAVYSLWVLPQSFYQKIEAFAMKMTGLSQKRRIQQDQVAN
jgi:glycosyltransferase involved in cell wall biosynthesis